MRLREWIRFDPDSLELGRYLWFGAPPQQRIPPLGDKISRHSKGNSKGYKGERLSHRVVKKGRFEKLTTVDEVAERLFGLTEAAASAPTQTPRPVD